MAKHIVIGSNSFSGQDFIDLLLDDPSNEVIGISRSSEYPDYFLRYKQRENLTNYSFQKFDLNLEMPQFLEFLDTTEPQTITNFAAQSEVAPSWENPDQWFQTNCVSLARLVKHLSERDYLDRYLHISSPEVYGSCESLVTETSPVNPSTPYAASKAAADMLLKSFAEYKGFPLVTVRATNVYGARQQLFKIMMRTSIFIRLNRRIPLHGGGQAIKSYIHIRDVSKGEKVVLERGRLGEIYHLSPEKGIRVRDVVAALANAMGKRLEDVAEDVEERLGQDAVYEIDSTKVRDEFGWRPLISFEDGVKEIVAWIDKYWSQIQDAPHEYIHRP